MKNSNIFGDYPSMEKPSEGYKSYLDDDFNDEYNYSYNELKKLNEDSKKKYELQEDEQFKSDCEILKPLYDKVVEICSKSNSSHVRNSVRDFAECITPNDPIYYMERFLEKLLELLEFDDLFYCYKPSFGKYNRFVLCDMLKVIGLSKSSSDVKKSVPEYFENDISNILYKLSVEGLVSSGFLSYDKGKDHPRITEKGVLYVKLVSMYFRYVGIDCHFICIK